MPAPEATPESSIRRSVSVRNIMNVADIEGATPSIAPDKVKNIARGKSFFERSNSERQMDTLGQYEKIFALKQLENNRSEILPKANY